nr:protein kinase-like domain, concanavalin A-like lectin/glucanase domain protein [Tanacetum cinerariifolium]
MKLRKKVVLSLAKLSTQTVKMQMKLMKKLKTKRKSRRKLKEKLKKKIDEDDPEHLDTFPTMKALRLEPRRKPSNPNKNCNFVGRVKGLRNFVGNFTYKCDFMMLEDTTSVIDHYLGSVVFGKPFMESTGLVYNKEEGTVVFERDKERIKFKMPPQNRHVQTHSLDLGPEYKYDEYVCRGIRSLMAAKLRRKTKEKSRKDV